MTVGANRMLSMFQKYSKTLARRQRSGPMEKGQQP